jgi:glycosyltransferase involved in cell wall biosynthesis
MPFFSIVIPSYNRAHIIGATINSVLEQTFSDFELIIVDDGSTDDTKQVIERYNDQRIRYIYQQNGERGKARNNGVNQSNGKYIFFLDSDDIIYPNHLALANEQLTKLQFPVFFHSRYEEKIGDLTITKPQLNARNITTKINTQNYFACAFYLRIDIAKEIRFPTDPSAKIGEDWAVIIRVAQRATLHFSNQVTMAIVQHPNRSMSEASADQILTSKNKIIQYLHQDHLVSAIVIGNVNAELTSLAALAAAIHHQRKKAIKLFFRSITKRPNLLFKRRTLAIFKHCMRHA